jgi:CubicO group peptidase (beta-lactamase class C family)
MAALVLTGCAAQPHVIEPSTDPIARLDAIVRGAEGVAAAGVVVVRIDADGREIALARGCARFEDAGAACLTPLTPQHWMRVASISKLFVAVAALQLVDAGKLSLDGDIAQVLGYELRNASFPEAPITLRQLLSHTSTLRDAERYSIQEPGTLRDLLNDVGRFAAERAPGLHFHYANINFGVIAALIERASGLRFDRYMYESVLRPAGIHAGYNWSGLEDVPLDDVAVLYRKREPNSEEWDASLPWRAQVDAFTAVVRSPAVAESYVLGSNSTLFSPQGGLRVRPVDVARFMRMLLGGEERALRALKLTPETRDVLCRPVFSEAATSITGDTEQGLYSAFGVGGHPKVLAQRIWCGHFAEAYGLKGGALYDRAARETVVYFVTGYAAAPPVGDRRYPGLDALEAAAFDVAIGIR